MQQLSQSLTENLSALDARFGQSADYYAKKIVLYGCPGCIVMFDGMASLDSLWELLLDAAGRQSASVRLTGTQAYAHILHGSAFPAESTPVQDMPQLVARLTAGMAGDLEGARAAQATRTPEVLFGSSSTLTW